ncbi:MAG: YdeI/OmpD-associated family protein [Bacillota bacterium]
MLNDQILFSDRDEFREWLTANHSSSRGTWLVFMKAGAEKSVKPDEALEEALCFGWIDGQIRSIDETKYLKWFSPRRKGSKWSSKNRALAERLVGQGKMAAPGFEAIERAKRDGTWEAPKPAPITEEQIDILVRALEGHEPALSNFQKMSPSVRRTYTAFYLDAKSEATRAKRLERIIGRLNENKKPM